MKKFYILFVLTAFLFAASAQTADYEIIGFADGNGNQIPSIVMNSTQDMQPRVILKNNGPGVVAASDSVIFDITYDLGYHVTYLVVMGTQLHSLGAGEQVIIDLAQPIWTAATMDEYSLIACTICYEVQIVGSTTDPNADNNRACIPVTRDLDINDAVMASPVTLFPNPASESVTLAGAENACVQLYDLSGRMLSVVERASENQLMDVSALAKGLYIVRISDGRSVVTQKLNVVR